MKEVISPASSSHPNSKVGSISGDLSPGARSGRLDSVPEQPHGTTSRHSQEPEPNRPPPGHPEE
jgi:hypothetical protein